MSQTMKEKIAQTLDKVSARARDIAKSFGLVPAPPRVVPIPIPAQPIRPRR